MRLELIIYSDCKINGCPLKTMKRCVLIDFDDGFFKYFQWKLKWYSRSFLHLELLEIGGSKRNWWIEEKWWWQACALRIRARASQRGEKNWRKLGNVSGLFSAMLCSCNVNWSGGDFLFFMIFIIFSPHAKFAAQIFDFFHCFFLLQMCL